MADINNRANRLQLAYNTRNCNNRTQEYVVTGGANASSSVRSRVNMWTSRVLRLKHGWGLPMQTTRALSGRGMLAYVVDDVEALTVRFPWSGGFNAAPADQGAAPVRSLAETDQGPTLVRRMGT
jgi:hypothetical protein